MSDAELARVLTLRHHIAAPLCGDALALDAIDAERRRLIAALESKDNTAYRLIKLHIDTELAERPRRWKGTLPRQSNREASVMSPNLASEAIVKFDSP